jgi:hypothetical protein
MEWKKIPPTQYIVVHATFCASAFFPLSYAVGPVFAPPRGDRKMAGFRDFGSGKHSMKMTVPEILGRKKIVAGTPISCLGNRSGMAHRYKNHCGSEEGIRRTIWKTRLQILLMVLVGGTITGVLIYLSLTK